MLGVVRICAQPRGGLWLSGVFELRLSGSNEAPGFREGLRARLLKLVALMG